ncbi:hypothetical protein COCON_G00080390 [Conger conger]|uniref:K Homology domain-containing protein n=1 Tax=Conger conger TaxID=82655 RepID=A0A9Q1DPG5_CONCO|nr:hypothetical protein COCON_G00080390 [Conger conger]
MSLPVSSPNSKLNLTSPKRGQKREDGWKEVVRRSKKLSVPASVVSRIMGRGGCNITAIQDVTGAHIDVDKQKDKNGERMITIRGGTESTRHAVQLINALIQDPAKELEDLIPRNHIRIPGTNTKMGSTFTTATGATSTTAAGSKGLPSVVPSSGMSFQASASSASSQAGGKGGKSLSPGVRPPFVSLPLAYAHPQLALLAAQTMHQIRHPRLPMAQFGGTFTPSPGTWGPFPVRPVSPGSANSSPKHNGGIAAPGGPRPGPSHGPEHLAPGLTPTASSAPSLPAVPTPSSVRKQLFSSEPKPAAVAMATAVTSAAATASSVRSSSSPAPLACTAPTTPPTPPPPPPPIAPPPTQQVPTPKPEPCPTATPSKEKPSEQQAAPVLAGAPEGPGALPFQAPLPPLASPPAPAARDPPASSAAVLRPRTQTSPPPVGPARAPPPCPPSPTWAPPCLISAPPALPPAPPLACSLPGPSTRWPPGAPSRTRTPCTARPRSP